MRSEHTSASPQGHQLTKSQLTEDMTFFVGGLQLEVKLNQPMFAVVLNLMTRWLDIVYVVLTT